MALVRILNIMIEFKITETELKELEPSFPGLRILIKALEEHEEIDFVVDDQPREPPSKPRSNAES